MYDLAVSEYGDLVFQANRDLLGVSGAQLIEQRIRTRLKIPRGSWTYDDEKRLGSRLHIILNHDVERAAAEIPVFVREALDEMEDITINNVSIDTLQPTSYAGTAPQVLGTNFCLNPSFETNLANWSTFGTNILFRDVSSSIFGPTSLRFTIGNDLRMAMHIITSPFQNYACLSGYLWIDAGWQGGGLFLTDDGTFSGATLVAQQLPDMSGAGLNKWQRIYSVYKLGDVKTGLLILRTANLGGGGNAWIDGIQIEDSPLPTDYIDGDQPGCKWLGNPHNSISKRYGYVPETEKDSGGRRVNILVNYSIDTPAAGAGAPSEPNEDELIISLPL
jgi:hypothetical protein